MSLSATPVRDFSRQPPTTAGKHPVSHVNPFTDSAISFCNSQGVEAHGVLISLSRESIAFEVYNPYSIVQMSEILTRVRIRRSDRDVYTGRACVNALINTGLMLVASASLLDPWSDVIDVSSGPELREEVRRFIGDWAANNRRLRPGYVHAVNSLRSFLVEFSRWLEHGEAIARLADSGTPQDRIRAFLSDVQTPAAAQLEELFQQFELEASRVEEAEVAAHKAFARRELHPLLMCAPFAHRVYVKPLGYAGDYEMVNMMFRDPWEGGNAYARVLNAFLLQNTTVVAHRQRIARLVKTLASEAQRVLARREVFRVLNVGCGPAIEVQRFLKESPLAERTSIELVDFNPETLRYAESQIGQILRSAGRGTQVVYRGRSVHELLRDSVRPTPAERRFDLVYCAGLFDYLGDRVCGRLLRLFYHWTDAAGLVVATNVHPQHPVRALMEHLHDWYLILRSGPQMLQLAPGMGDQDATTEATGVNVFLEIRKGANEA